MGAQLLILLSYILLFAFALLFVALGGMFTERSGVINIGLEGTMVVGGFVGIVILNLFYKVDPATNTSIATIPEWLIVIIVILSAMIAGMLYSLLLAVACIQFKADQTLVGTALNILATAVVLLLCKKASSAGATSIQFVNKAFTFSNGNFFFNIFQPIGIIVLIISLFVLFKTKFGLQLRSCGENPAAADSVGINVKKYRYIGVLISGALSGVGALAYILPSQFFWNSNEGVAGFGFLALAVMIFGQWKPLRIFIVSLFFSFFMSLSFVYSQFFKTIFDITLTAENGVTAELFKMVPYIASLILLAFTSKNSRAPKSEGIPYDKGAR